MATFEEIFKELSAIDFTGKTEKKENLTYLSWTYAVEEVSKRYPLFTYEVERFDNKPYLHDDTGYMVFTKITIEGITKAMWLPVMDGANKSMLDHSYQYTTKYGTRDVTQCTMFDINKTIMRCLVKNLAMFGLGLYIYNGEDLPTNDEESKIIQNPKGDKKDTQINQKEPKKATPLTDEDCIWWCSLEANQREALLKCANVSKMEEIPHEWFVYFQEKQAEKQAMKKGQN